MISLRTYLLGGADKEDVESSYRRMIDLFLQGIFFMQCEGDQAYYQRFRTDDTVSPAAGAQRQQRRWLRIVGEVLRALEDYNRHTSKFLRIQNTELQNMVAMLTQTVIAVGTSSETSVAGLQQIEKALN